MQSAKSRRDTTTTPTEFEAKDGFEVAFKRFPETQMAQLYGQRKEGKFCDAVLHCTDGEIKLHRCIMATLCGRDLEKPLSVPVKTDAVRRLANLCYTGYLKVNIENLKQDIDVAKALECEFVLTAAQKWVTDNLKQVTATEKALKDLDVEIVKGCIGNVKYMNENWQDFVTHWAAMDPERKKDLVDLQKLLDKCAFVSIYRFVVVGGKTVKFDGNVVLEESWQVPQNDRVIIVNGKAKKRVNIARNGALSLYIGDKHKMTHSHRALGLYESVRPVIIWLNDGTLLKVVDKTDPFEDLANEEKEAYLGQAWKKSPLPDACADLFIVHEFAAVLHYPGHGTCYMSPKTATGYQAWVQIPISDVHHAYSDGRRLLLVTRDVNTYTIVDGHTFQTLMTLIRGNPRQSPLVIPSFCQEDNVVVAIIDLEKTPKTFYFVQYSSGRGRVLSEAFEALPSAHFTNM